MLPDVRWGRGPPGSLPEGSNPIVRSPSGANDRPKRPCTCIGTESKMRPLREGKKHLKEGLMRDTKVTEEDGEDDKEADTSSAHSQSGVKLLSSSESGKPVDNVIPLPPRKPTNHSQSASPAVVHRSVASEDKGTGGGWGASNTPQSPAEHSEKMEHGQEGRTRRVSEDRPKLDKSHSTPAYDMEGDIGQGSLSAPLAPVKPASPSRSPATTTASATAQVSLGKSEPSEPSRRRGCSFLFYSCSFF